ncbi:MAG: hypothetical protein NC406_07640 [Bacteroides sp.]|nr:hypothetical protein [Bacteroides sp.]MCM1096261.1 hypothetical protein [Terasakiella sp.]
MKHFARFTAAVVCLVGAATAIAQTSQPGIVLEYNERAAKTPLPGVELNIRSAGATASGADGRFALDFPTLHAGDRVTVRSVAKPGYEIFNKEAVEQWNINPSRPFTLVMCRTDRFRRIRDLYERNASENYRRQYSRERAAIDRLRSEGKLRDEEYRRRLAEIQENFDRQLDNLDNYVDRFARIDLSDLSDTEAAIIELVQAGRFDEAIARYDSLQLVDKYRAGLDQHRRISSAIDRLAAERDSTASDNAALLAAITRRVDSLTHFGGRENILQAAAYLANLSHIHDLARKDTTLSTSPEAIMAVNAAVVNVDGAEYYLLDCDGTNLLLLKDDTVSLINPDSCTNLSITLRDVGRDVKSRITSVYSDYTKRKHDK